MSDLFQYAVRQIGAMGDELGPFGWEFLYCPASLLSDRSSLWFLGINPGGTLKRKVEQNPDGNAYNLERWSPDREVLRKQVIDLFGLLAAALNKGDTDGAALLERTLTSNFCPFHF